jgi:hypothetical protein
MERWSIGVMWGRRRQETEDSIREWKNGMME